MARNVIDHRVPGYKLLRNGRPGQLFYFAVHKRQPGEYYLSLKFYEDETRLCFKFGFESEKAALHVADYFNSERISLQFVERLCIHYIDVKYLGTYSPEQAQRLICDRVKHESYIELPNPDTLEDVGASATAG